MGRLGEPDEIRKAAVFLPSDDASYVAGIEFFADGGAVQVCSQAPANSPMCYSLTERSVPRMNTKTKQDQKNQRPEIRQMQRPAKRGPNPYNIPGRKHPDHEQEHPETRMTR